MNDMKLISKPSECGYCNIEENFRDEWCKHPRNRNGMCIDPHVFPTNCLLQGGITEEQCRLRCKLAEDIILGERDGYTKPKSGALLPSTNPFTPKT
jgi:hypothetical protein